MIHLPSLLIPPELLRLIYIGTHIIAIMTISDTFTFMSDSVIQKINTGAYGIPHSGVGMEFAPLDASPVYPTLLLHEAGYLAANREWNFPGVLSPFWRIYHNLDKGHWIKLDGEMYRLDPDRILIIPDHQLFHCEGQHVKVRSLWLHFSTSQQVADEQKIPIILHVLPGEKLIINRLASELRKNVSQTIKNEIFHHSHALIHLLLARADINWKKPPPPALVKLQKYIETHLSEKLPNERLAKESNMSVETLGRLFKTHLNMPPARYVTQLRISKAGHMLEQTDMSIEVIAEITGFPNRAYFSRVFKQVTALSPAAFRARIQLHRSKIS